MRAQAIIARSVCWVVMASGPMAYGQSAADKSFEACKAKLQKANELGVLYAFDWKPPTEPYVVMGKTFMQIAIDAKEGVAETLNCFLSAGKPGQCINFDVLHWQSGKPIGRWQNCKLKMR